MLDPAPGSARAVDDIVRATPRLGRPALLAVDGVDGSGKTTFAAALAAQFARGGRAAHVVHMDDFMNPRAVRYRLGRDSPHGYVSDTYDLASFATLVLEPLSGPGRRITLRAFDYRTDQPVHEDPVAVEPDAVVIVEGMFLHRDELRDVWDLSVFLQVPFAVSVARLAVRDGSSPDPDDPSMRRYVEGQRIYLAACRPERRATFVIAN